METEHGLAHVLDAAMTAVFGGTIPAIVDRFVDRDAVGRMGEGYRLSIIVETTNGAERASVGVRTPDPDGSFRARVVAQWPAAADALARAGAPEVQYEIDADGNLCVLFFGARIPGTSAPAGEPIGGFLFLTADGPRVEAFTMHPAPPWDHLDPGVRARVQAAWDAGVRGQWFCRWDGDTAHVCAMSAETPTTAESVAWIRGQAGPAVRAAEQALRASGMEVQPWGVLWHRDGSTQIRMWGLQKAVGDEAVPAIFHRGELPDEAGFAKSIADLLLPTDRAIAEALVRDHLYPALRSTRPADVDPDAWFLDAWRAIYDWMADTAPPARLALLRATALGVELYLSQDEAFHLGLQRYLLEHPQATRPGEDVLPAAMAALDRAAVEARATELLARIATVEQAYANVPDISTRVLAGLAPNLAAMRDTAERAISGSFVAATGRLHEYLQAFGPTALDEDPWLKDVADIELDAEGSAAAIEEALAKDS